jgi:hypothetical protein
MLEGCTLDASFGIMPSTFARLVQSSHLLSRAAPGWTRIDTDQNPINHLFLLYRL